MNGLTKKNTVVKRILAYLGAVLTVFFLFTVNAGAEEYIQDKNGSIGLTLQQTDENGNTKVFSGINMKLYRIGNVKYDMGAVSFELDDVFSSAGINLNTTNTAGKWAEASEKLADMAGSSGLGGDERTTDANGKIVYEDLTQGAYLLVQGSSDQNVKVAPMILTVPFMEEGEWLYDIETYPKVSVIPATPTSTPTPAAPSKPATPVKTGDTANAMPWVISLIGAAAVISAVVYIIKRKKEY